MARADIGLIDVLQTTADDVGAAVAFYRDVLGAEVQSEGGQWARVRLGGVDLGIHAAPAGYEGWMPAFRVADVATVKASIEAAGGEHRDYHDIPGGVSFQFMDPAGNWLAVIQYGVTAAALAKAR